MKKYLFTIAAIAMSCAVSAQTMNVHFKNGTMVQFTSETVDYVDFAEKPADPTLTAGDYVDLGLPSGTKWATCNLGATKPTELGNKYAWGETSTKTSYTQSNYAYYNSSTASYTDLGTDISGTQYDAATVNLGKDWRMPTKQEYKELYDKCQLTWTTVDGNPGYLVTGPNGNTIFIMAASKTGYTYYWSATPSSGEQACYSGFTSDFTLTMSAVSGKPKYFGYYIRPIYVGTGKPSTETDPAPGIANITDYITVNRTGQSTQITNGVLKYVVTFEIKNTSTEKIHLTSLGGVDINQDLAAGKTYSISLQSSTSYLTNYYQELLFTYNSKSYSVKG